jgi:hypothetical protein
VFCARCGQQIPDVSELCPLCGQQTTLKLDPVPSTATAQLRPPYAFVTVPQNLGPRGVGGWLFWYCIFITILGPLALVGQLLTFQFRNPLLVLEVIRLLYGVVVGVFLWIERPLAIQLLRIYFIFLAAIFLLVFLRLASFALARHTTVFQLTGFVSTVLSAIFSLLWFLYFHKSERVRNTYGRNL